MARRATLIDSLRIPGAGFLLVDAGNFAEVNEPLALEKSRFVFDMLGRLGYQAVTLGTRDLRLGPDAFSSPDLHGPPIVLTNVVDTRTGACPAERSIIVDAAGHRVGILGLVSPNLEAASKTKVPSYRIDDPFEATETILGEFDEQGVELVVALIQLEKPLFELFRERFKGRVDLAVLGNRDSGDFRDAQLHTEAGMHTVVPEKQGRSLSQVDFFDVDGALGNPTNAHHPVTLDVRPEPEIAALVTEVMTRVTDAQEARRREQKMAANERAETDTYLGATSCKECHESQYEGWSDSPHAHAYDTLVTFGMQTTGDCLHCHTVGYGTQTGFRSASGVPDLAGVQCESCHGIGSEHFAVMTIEQQEYNCRRCHDAANSPDFEYEPYMERIRHW